MYVLTSDIEIGGKAFGGVHQVVVRRSVNELAATATIKVPVTAVLTREGEPPTRTETAKAVRVGDPVRIALGYDGRLTTEFIGYVRAVNLRTPVEIECEDAFYLCRARPVTLSGKATLSEVLQKCGLEVAYAETLTLSSFVVKDKTVSNVLGMLKKDYGLSVFFDLHGRVYACRPVRVVGETVKYELRRNVISDDELQYHAKEDVKIYVKAICFKKDGSKVEAVKGDQSGTAKVLYFYNVSDMGELAAMAQRELERYSYDGYSGSVTTFLEPYAAPCMVAEITDPVYPARSGNYFIESVETTYGQEGARRKVEITVKI